jgi:hypothetical protein
MIALQLVSDYYNMIICGMSNLGAREPLVPVTRLVAAVLDPSTQRQPSHGRRRCSLSPVRRIGRRRCQGPSRRSALCGPALGSVTRSWRESGVPRGEPSTTRALTPRREGGQPLRSTPRAFAAPTTCRVRPSPSSTTSRVWRRPKSPSQQWLLTCAGPRGPGSGRSRPVLGMHEPALAQSGVSRAALTSA